MRGRADDVCSSPTECEVVACIFEIAKEPLESYSAYENDRDEVGIGTGISKWEFERQGTVATL